MRKIRLISAVFAALFFTVHMCVPALPASVSASSLPAVLRVGLESSWRNAGSVPIDSPALAVGYNLGGNGNADLIGNAAAVITRSSAFVAVPAPGPFVRKASAASYGDAAALARSLAGSGQGAAPALDSDGTWSVFAYGYASEAAARADADASGGAFLADNGLRVMLTDGGICAVVFENGAGFCRVADAYQGATSLGGRSYRGAIELTRAGGGLTAVNVVSFQDYLKSVVPSEMPPGWNPEALKAQAVACRNYALANINSHAGQGYDLCDKVHCQNYAGAGGEAASTNAAVDATDGYLIYYGGMPVDAVYFSSSGGVTENSENVWSNAVPYLRSVDDPYEYEPKEWVRSFTLEELTRLVDAGGASIGAVTGVSVTAEPSGRAAALYISGTSGVRTLLKEEIRTFFANSAGGPLESRNFTIQTGGPAGAGAVCARGASGDVWAAFPGLYAAGKNGIQKIDSAAAVDAKGSVVYLGAAQNLPAAGVTFTGRGWGHGVGMSQRGAEGLARRGYDFIAILQYYYTGVSVTNG
ncbi:MAG: SpoIID/LytB domain-containing protein [Firmicutes bacterium]|nr:SpoIID/LytB domain-containing protein [Bacillota bacterium]